MSENLCLEAMSSDFGTGKISLDRAEEEGIHGRKR